MGSQRQIDLDLAVLWTEIEVDFGILRTENEVDLVILRAEIELAVLMEVELEHRVHLNQVDLTVEVQLSHRHQPGRYVSPGIYSTRCQK